MTPVPEKIIERIKACLALAGNNPDEHEAALAMSRAQEMAAAYNLELAELQAQSNKPITSDSIGKRSKKQFERSALFQYQRDLWEALAKANFCWYEAIPEWKTNTLGHMLKANYRHYVIGREDNVITTELMGDYLESALKRLCPFPSGKEHTLWKEGAVSRLVDRLNTKRYEMERKSEEVKRQAAAQNQSTGIVLSSVYQSEDDMNYLFVHGQEAYDRRMSYKHDQDNCVCQYCSGRREQNRRCAEQNKAALAKVETPKETDAQRRKREEAERKRSDRYWEKHERDQEEKRQRTGHEAYRQGHTDANNINLDGQISSKKQGGLK